MKMTSEHYEVLEQAFQVFTKEQLASHMQQYKTAGLTERRARFDAFWAVNKRVPALGGMMREFYKYANDDHLYTALKKVMT